MKKFFTLMAVTVMTLTVLAQAPQKMSYQFVVRNSSGTLLANHTVGIKISILQGSVTGTVIFAETYSPNPQTNANGLVSLEIGSGTALTGTLTGINWAQGPYFLKTETDPEGGTSYTISGTSQLLSVPYALYAKTAANGFSGAWADITNKPTTLAGYGITDADGSITNEIQSLNLSGTILSLSNGGGSVTLPSSGGGDNWGTQVVVTDPTLSGNGTTATPLRIADNGVNSSKVQDGSIVTIDLADQTVSTAKLGNLAVSAEKIQNSAVTTDKLANGSVTGAKIAQGSAVNGYVLKWNGTTWAPAQDNEGGLTLPYNESGTSGGPLFNIVNLGTSGAISTLSAGNYGIWGESSSVMGIGVYGVNKTSPGTTYGVFGDVYSSEGFSGYFQGGKFYVQGNAGIGTQTPGAKLEVAGQVKITGGTPGTGKVLTSDATGLASWQTPSSGPWLLSGSNVYYNGGDVGIGTSSPRYKLTIYDLSYSIIQFLNPTSGTGTGDGFIIGTQPTGSPVWIWNFENSNMHFATNNANRMIINADGHISMMRYLDLNTDGTFGALYVKGKQALWSDDIYFSWGYDATYNYFAKKVTIGNPANPGYMLYVQGTAYATGTWSSSDARFKKNIATIDNPLEKLMKVRGARFEFRADEFKDYQFAEGPQFGFIAQELEEVLPEVVKTESDGYKSVNYNEMIPVLVEALKDQQKQIDELKKEIALLKSE